MRVSHRVHASQRGAALIVSLVFMLIITIISVASMQSATLQERMAGNAKDEKLAFQAAEAALREAESQLSQVSVGPFTGAKGLYRSCPDPADTSTACSEPDWRVKTSVGWQVLANAIPDASRQPEYIIEEMTSIADADAAIDSDRPVSLEGFYRVTARGFGASDRSMVVLSTTFKRDGN
ncbi:PilX N-terminal domain-containing pilus assembly protein [Spongiibacter taiwanensis]|uniref:pilus assembly PilX family protein n=1 Tax=Spongiibacter taiwanensis TaxID=1748242 RepID=UPI002034D2E0|nr:PilX N-terminal domain-containing pilus assembly protein [Spongiibacter taiwanensis]USA44198.1 PilX N-terminal domain-containing pilus assembly protein [Spongiibacter taiwanensis]